MTTRKARAFLADELQGWVTGGLVPPQTATVLRERWSRPGFGLASVMKYLGAIGGGCTLLGLLGLVASMSESKTFQGALTLGIAAAFLLLGQKLWADPRGRSAHSSRLLLGIGTAAFGFGVWLLLDATPLASSDWELDLASLLTSAFAFTVAYRYRIRFLLFIALFTLLSWIGTSPSMHGRSTYSLDIAQTAITLLAGSAAVAFGLWHARSLDERYPGFSLAYQVMGLVYANVVLLGYEIESVRADALPRWIAIFAVSIAQVVLGARLLNALLTGFGVTLAVVMGMAIYGERCWDRLDHGTFFLLGGAVLFAMGFAFERRQREVSP